MRWTTKHYLYLSEPSGIGRTLGTAQTWDAIRMDGMQSAQYSLPPDRVAWIQRCRQNGPNIDRAEQIVRLLRDLGARRVFSAGVGRACLEYNVRMMDPTVSVVCGDYAPWTVAKVREYFLESDGVEHFDMRGSMWPEDFDLYLLHRVDSELTTPQWRDAFEAMKRAGVPYVLFIPDLTLSRARWVRERAKGAMHVMRSERVMFAGYIRTVDSLRALWSRSHTVKQELELGGLRGFLLERAP